MSLGKVARKLKRVGKTAYQFRITSTFEYIALGCNGTWRPENLRVIWIRSHRRVQSIDVKWQPSEDRGPNGALGKATFDPSFAVALLVTVYGDTSGKEGHLEEKEYKYYIESDGPSGKKIVASFNMDISEYATLNGSRHTLDMSFKPMSKKINKAVLGITLQSEFMKQGNAIDDDMQSTFSAVSAGQDSLQFDEEEELEAAEAATSSDGTSDRGLPLATGDTELVTLGTGERLKRTTLPKGPPMKPERRGTPGHSPCVQRKFETDEREREMETQFQAEAEPETAETGETGLMYMNLNAEGQVGSVEGGIEEAPWERSDEEAEEKDGEPPREKAKDRRTSRRAKRQREKQEKDRERQEEKERRQKERERRLKEKSPTPERRLKDKSKSPTPERRLKDKSKSPTPEACDSPALPPREKSPLTNGEHNKEEEMVKDEENDKRSEEDDENAAKAAEVVMTTKLNDIAACGQSISVVFDTRSAGEGSLSAVCKGTKTETVETSFHEESNGHYRIQFTPTAADMFMLSVLWSGHNVPGSPFLINLNLLPPAETPPGGTRGGGEEGGETREMEQSDGCLGEIANQPRENGVDREGEEHGDKRSHKEEVKEVPGESVKEGSREMRGKSPGVTSPVILVSDEDPFDMAHRAGRMLEEQRAAAASGAKSHSQTATPTNSGRKVVASKEEWTPPTNHVYEDMPEGDEEEGAAPTVSPLEAWLGDAQFVNCFGEVVSREKLEDAEIIGLYFSANWCPPCRRFLPKLVKFYHNLKQNQKRFEMLYISSDYSKQEMSRYMQEQQMPWMSLAFDSTVADKLRVDYDVAAIPILTIVSKSGVKLEERARKAVEQATTISAVLKLYNKWLEKSQQHSEGEEVAEKKGGLLKTLKSTIAKPSREQTVELSKSPGGFDSQKSVGDASDTEGGGARVTVEQRSRSRSKQKGKESSSGRGPTVEEMEEKEERLRHLEEVNMSLKQTNDDLNEEVAELKRQIGDFQAKLTSLEKSSRQLEDEKRELMANLNIRGWLLKRGLKGPTASLWRRRYFRCDQGSKIYYYKSASEGTPQGFIDLDLVVSVQEISPAQQDKNHATFLVQCERRTFQLQAHDETTMRKWMSAIEYLKNWSQRNASSDIGP